MNVRRVVQSGLVVTLCLVASVALADNFVKTKNAAISGHNIKQLRDVTPKACMQACESERSFVCKSFDYHKKERWCDLSDKAAGEVGGLKRDYKDHPYDHYARPRFEKIKNAAISGHNLKKVTNVTPEQCRSACLSERSFQCRSFDYNKKERWCDLSDATAKSAGGLKRNYDGNPYDHYHRNW